MRQLGRRNWNREAPLSSATYRQSSVVCLLISTPRTLKMLSSVGNHKTEGEQMLDLIERARKSARMDSFEGDVPVNSQRDVKHWRAFIIHLRSHFETVQARAV